MRKKSQDKQKIILDLISILEKNSRMRNKDIAKQLGISEKSVKIYIEYLLSSGLIKGFTVIKGSTSSIQAFVNINVFRGTSTASICKELVSKGLCDSVAEVSGEYDIMCKTSADTIDSLNAKIDEIRNLKGVEKTRSFIVLRSW